MVKQIIEFIILPVEALTWVKYWGTQLTQQPLVSEYQHLPEPPPPFISD